MKLSLIVAVYKRDDFLALVFESIERQSFRDFELIVAEDDQDPRIAAVVEELATRAPFPVRHVSQEDRGFRKNRIANRAAAVARGEYLVFIDGDCVLHPCYLEKYAERARPGLCLFGLRVMLDRGTTERLLRAGTVAGLGLLRVLRSRSRNKEEAIYLPWLRSFRSDRIRGCSFCVHRRDLLAINGFDEDFEQPYFGEDTDVYRRLRLHGVRFRCTRYATLQYHLHHDPGDRRESWEASERLFLEKSARAAKRCRNGIEGPAAESA